MDTILSRISGPWGVFCMRYVSKTNTSPGFVYDPCTSTDTLQFVAWLTCPAPMHMCVCCAYDNYTIDLPCLHTLNQRANC